MRMSRIAICRVVLAGKFALTTTTGERFSIVAYTRIGSHRLPLELGGELSTLGFVLPSEESMMYYKALLYSRPYLECRELRSEDSRKGGKRPRIL